MTSTFGEVHAETFEALGRRVHGEVEHLVPTGQRLILLAVELLVGLGEVEQAVQGLDGRDYHPLYYKICEFALRKTTHTRSNWSASHSSLCGYETLSYSVAGSLS